MLALEPLDPESVDLLVRDLLGTDASPEVVALLHERSGGNPFFVEELAALLRETGAVDGDTAGRLLEPGRLPVTLQGLVAARLDALGTAERNVLEDCAIVGASGSIEAVHALAAVRGDALDPETALEQLADRELLDLDGFEFKFANEVVRDVAYATLTKAERARRHAALGEWLAARTPADDGGVAVERVAHHFGTAALLLRELGPIEGVPADLNARALDALELAADRAREAEVWHSAARLFDHALAVLPAATPDETRWRLQLGRARSLAELRELTAARADLDDVLEDAAGDARATARALTVLGDLHQMEGEYDASIATLDRAIAAWHALGDEAGEADALRAAGAR